MEKAHIYKFLKTEHLNFVLDGSIRISRDSVFREAEEKAQWIADRLENVSEAVFGRSGPQIYDADTVNATALPGRPAHIRMSPGITTSMQNVSFQYTGLPFYLYSASHGDLSRLVRIMCDEAPLDERRDACVEIINFSKLAEIIFKHGCFEIKGKKIRMREKFSDFKQDPVVYRSMSIEPGTQMAEPSPFIKDEIFKDQSEVRIAFTPRTAIEPKTLDIRIDRPARVFREVFRNRPPPAP